MSAATPTRAIALLSFAAFASQSMVRVSDSLLPQIAGDLGVTIGAASAIVSVYGAAHGSVQLVIGPIGDRFGKYRSVATACALSAVLVIICGFAQSLPALVMARLACGLSAGCIIPLGMAFVGDTVPFERRQPVLARFFSGQILGMLFGQAAGGILGDYFGWRQVFFFLALLFGAATLALIAEMVRNPATRESTSHDQPRHGLAEGYSLVLRSAWSRTVILAVFLEGALMFGSLAYAGAYLHLRFDLSLAGVGLLIGTYALGGLAYALSVATLVRRLGQQGLLRYGAIVIACGLLLLAFEPVWWLSPIALAAMGIGYYMLHNTLQVNATQMTPQARGTAVAIFSASFYLGQTTGVAIGSLLVDRFSAVPIFVYSALLFPFVGFWFAHRLRMRAAATP